MYELTLAYVVQGPKTKHFSTSAQFGGGGLFFLPTLRPSLYHGKFSGSMVFGVGTSYDLTDHLALKAEYRGLFYRNPNFGVGYSKLLTVTSEPTISVVYNFGGTKKNLRKTH
jgi:opacity protein-like surface antigen